MTESKLRAYVAETVALDRQVQELTADLKERKVALIHEASSRPEDCVATEGGGSSWTYEGCDGCVARVTFPGPTLKSKVDAEKAVEKLRMAAGPLFSRLFTPGVVYRPIPNIREEATALMGKKADKLIRLIESDSSPKVSFETREKA